MKWDPTDGTEPIGFYNRYRSIIISNLKKTGTHIHWMNEKLEEDEYLMPSHEDLIIINVLERMHPKLPALIKD